MATYYVSPTGNDSNEGTTLNRPLATIAAAHELVAAGDSILLRGGVYDLPKDTTTVLSKSGAADAPITLAAFQDERPILDGGGWARDDGQGGGGRNVLIAQTGDYWRVEGLEITGGPFLGYLADSVDGSVFEDLNVHGNDNTGFNLFGESSNNLILGGEFHNNFDPQNDGQNADGIGIKFGSGEGNVVDGVSLYDNSDDGIDLWSFKGSVTIRNAEAFGHGVDIWGHGPSFEGDGNGFKLSGGDAQSGSTIKHVVHNSVAWGNGSRGFDYNGGQGAFDVFNNTAYDNGFAGFFFEGGAHRLQNNLSFGNGVDQRVADGVTEISNSWNGSTTVSAADFASLDPASPDFLRLAPDSGLIDAGASRGAPFNGANPDLGAFETGSAPTDGGAILGTDGDDVVTGTDAVDLIRAGAGADGARGFGGADTISGGAGDDFVAGDGGADELSGDAGADLLSAGAGDDVLFGNDDDDTLWGGSGDDLLNGGGDDDFLAGGAGADYLIGGAGSNQLSGGGGADVFAFVSPASSDVVYDFRSGEDRLAVNGATFEELTLSQGETGAEIRWEQAAIVVVGVSADELTASDFVF